MCVSLAVSLSLSLSLSLSPYIYIHIYTHVQQSFGTNIGGFLCIRGQVLFSCIRHSWLGLVFVHSPSLAVSRLKHHVLFCADMGRPKCSGRLATLWDTRGCGKQLPESARATNWNCVTCGLRLCKTCCDCDGGCGFGGKGAVNGVYIGTAAPPIPVAPPAREEPVQRARSRSQEGRRYARATIERHLLSQWRYVAIGDRPLPPAGRLDSGLVGYGTWSQGLLGEARTRTRELLDGEDYRQNRCVSSVHLSLYLRWAEAEFSGQEEAQERERSSRVGAMDLGRHIQSFLL